MDAAAHLHRLFGHASFRPGQQEAVEAAFAERDALVVMPTGSGKSLCYQLPGLALDGLTIVISPLVALMRDQGDALAAAGHGAARVLNASLPPGAAEVLQAATRVLAGVALRSLDVLDSAVTLPQFRLLAVLADLGPAPSGRAARALGLDAGTIEAGKLADLVLLDGGQGQLSAGLAVLTDLGIEDVCMAAIAKGPDRNAGREQFFLPTAAPFMLPNNHPVLYFLQRLRDEAHRFAQHYHHMLRKKRTFDDDQETN